MFRLPPFWLFLSLLYFFTFSTFASSLLIVEPDEGRQPVLAALQQAKTSLDLAMYGFTDPELIQAFIQAKGQGKKVRILLQHFPYKSVDENLLAIQRFSASRVNLAYAPSSFYLLHQKTLVLDQRSALVLTFNFTRSAFENERNFGLVIRDPAEVKEVQMIFDADWQNKKLPPSHSHLIWSPDNSREKILGLIGSAKTEIKVYAQGLSDYEVIGALAAAARRGIKIEILTSESQADKKWAYLQKAGVHFAFDKQLVIHAKVLLIDRQKALLGSINFTQPSLDRNRELSVLVNDARVIQQLLEVFAKDWRTSQTS